MHTVGTVLLGATAVSAAIIKSRDQTFSDYTRNPTYNANFGVNGQLTTVNPGASVWLSGGSTHNFFGNLNNYGTIVVSQTDYLKQNPNAGGQSSSYIANGALGGNVNNYAGGFISLNDFGSKSAPSYYWNLQTLNNAGGIQFCGRGDTGGSTYSLTTRQSSINRGLIDFGQYNGNKGGAFYYRNYVAGDSTTLTNEGAVRLTNVVFHNTQNIYGSGCWILNSGSVLYLEDGTGVAKNPTRGPSFPGQKIYFAKTDSTLHMDIAVYSAVPNFGADVYGFGQGKAIEFIQTITSFSYSSGVLNVRFGSYSVNIRIGAGYIPSQFRRGLNTEPYGTNNAIFYDGPTPAQAVPGVCVVSQQTCADPATTVGGPSTTSTASSVQPTSTSVVTTSDLPSTTSSAAVSTSAASSTTSSDVITSPAPSTTSSVAVTSIVPTTQSSDATSEVSATSSSSAAITTESTAVSTTASSTTATTSAAAPSGVCANGASPSSTYTAANGDVYGICRGTDFPAGDLVNVHDIPTVEACAEECSKTAGCIASTLHLDSKICYLKKDRNGADANPGDDSAYNISSAS